MQKYLAIILFLTAIVSGFAQSGYGPRHPVVLKYADSLVGSSDEGAIKRELIGRVHLEQANVVTHCDRAIQYFGDNRFELIGHVVISQEGLTIRAPKIIYYGDSYLAKSQGDVQLENNGTILTAKSGNYSTFTHIADFFGDVLIENDSVKIKADTITYNKETEDSFAHGSAVLRSKKRSSLALGDSIWHYKTADYSILKGDAFVIKLDTAAKLYNAFSKDSSKIIVYDTTLISARYLESIGKENYFFAKDSVNISGKNYFAKCDTSFLYESQNLARLIGNPELKSDSLQVFSDTIEITRSSPEYFELIARNRAIFSSRQDTLRLDRIDQISGAKISCVYFKDTVRTLISEGDAKSLYFMTSDSLPDGAERTSCDRIYVIFQAKKIDKIEWLSEVYGDQYPEPIIAGAYKTYYLPTFRWKDNWGKPRAIPAKYINNMK